MSERYVVITYRLIKRSVRKDTRNHIIWDFRVEGSNICKRQKNRKYKKYRKVRARKIMFDFLKKRQYNYKKRVASKRKSSLPATRFLFCKK